MSLNWSSSSFWPCGVGCDFWSADTPPMTSPRPPQNASTQATGSEPVGCAGRLGRGVGAGTTTAGAFGARAVVATTGSVVSGTGTVVAPPGTAVSETVASDGTA